jgi:hypothetical protein
LIADDEVRSGAGVAPALAMVPARGWLGRDGGALVDGVAPNAGAFVGGFPRDDDDDRGGMLGTFMRDDEDELDGGGGTLGTFMRDDEDELDDDDDPGAGGGTLGAFMREDEAEPDNDDAFVGDLVRSGDGTIGRTAGGELGPGRRAGCE